MEFLTTWSSETWQVLLEAGPWLVGGFLLAGVIHVFVPVERVARHLGGSSMSAVLKASLLGVPLPLCSCSVIPVAASIRKQGAGRGATASFLISTPETGADSIAVSYALLGPFLAIVRPIAAFVTAFVAGAAINRFAPDTQDETTPSRLPDVEPPCCESTLSEPRGSARAESPHGNSVPVNETSTTTNPTPSSCCESTLSEPRGSARAESPDAKSATVDKTTPTSNAPSSSCCCSHSTAQRDDPTESTTTPTWSSRIVGAVRYGLGDMFADLGHWLLLGFVLAGLIGAVVPEGFFGQHLGSGPLAFLLMIAVALPLYVCATSSTPIAAALIAAGVSPGTALVFLLVGPATNVATMVVVARTLGRRSLVLYLVCIVIVAVLFGLITDAFISSSTGGTTTHALHAPHMAPGWLTVPSAILLALLIVRGVVVHFRRRVHHGAPVGTQHAG